MSNNNNKSGINSIVICGGIRSSEVGSAGLGFRVAREALMTTKDTRVRVLIRKDSNDNSQNAHVQELRNLGADIQEVDFNNQDSFRNQLNGYDAVLSFMSDEALGEPQRNLARCAKECGAKLFVPSEFGINTRNVRQEDNSPLYEKRQTQEFLKKEGIPHTIFLAGAFADHAKMILDIKENSARVAGNGQERVSWTSLDDVSRFVVYSIRELKINDLKDRTLAIEGSRATSNDLVEYYNKRHHTNLNVQKESQDDALNRWKNQQDRAAYVRYELARGNGDVGKGENISNGLWKNFNPTPIEHYM